MIKDFKIEAFSKPVSDLSDNPLISAGELKAHFDSNSYELLDALNGLIMHLSGEDALSELKLSGKGLNELFSGKVDKEAGKGLSEADFTNAEKTKLNELFNYDDTSLRAELEKKVDKVAGKGLSEADFTNAEKNKLKELFNYDDTSLRAELEKKVDKTAGMGLSENNYSDFEKNKIGFIEYVDYESLDNLSDGAYVVMEAKNNLGMSMSGFLLIQTSYEQDLGDTVEYIYTQTKYDHDGYIYQRKAYGINEADAWQMWERVKPNAVSVYDTLTSDSTTAALSANMGRELDEKKVDNVRFESTVGDIEAALDSIIALQNTYTETTVTRHYNTCGYYYDEAVEYYYLSIDYEYGGGAPIQCDNMYTAEENASITDDTVGLTIECHVYDTDWNLVYSGTGACRADCGGWALYGDVSNLTLDGTYYLTRADDLAPVNTELPTHEFAEVSE